MRLLSNNKLKASSRYVEEPTHKRFRYRITSTDIYDSTQSEGMGCDR
jgi:hypothetical protein